MATSEKKKEAFRATLTTVLERRLFFIPSFKIYGGVKGLYDFGPPGCAIKQNITRFWREHFVLEEAMLEVECPAVTPEVVLQASGHVERFTDFMVTDMKTGECYRADHLLEAALEALLDDPKSTLSEEERKEVADTLASVEELDCEALGATMTKYGVKAPDTKNDISAPFPFNLMFKTSIGPKGDMVGYLRPETAQNIFVNFRDLLYYNGGKLPFAAAQIGQSFRNEISPRAGLLRVREFTQAEIEHFLNPSDKNHPKFSNIKDLTAPLFSRELQKSEEKAPKEMSFGDAVAQKMIANETLAYFMARTFLFMQNIGIDTSRLRFRQHLEHEMAHYAEDCWDCELHSSYGWVECVGLADRSAFDLRAHSAKSKTDLVAHEKFSEPRMEEVLEVKPNRKELGVKFKTAMKAIVEQLAAMCEEDSMAVKAKFDAGETASITADGSEYELTASMVEIKRTMKKVSGRTFTPSVIEPSFGIGRIIYCLLEHAFYSREGEGNEARTVFRFKPLVAPVKATVFSLMQRDELNDAARALSAALTAARIANIVDTGSTTVGKRYARTDEIGVPFAVTVDFATLQDGTVTLRERDSMVQVRLPSDEVPEVIGGLVREATSWEQVVERYPEQAAAGEGS
ncbi:unnamed protein product [Ostreobium quekettii]|uniref:Glycine--tRNA ligase n=1 Tax=Ostreobium quekettii TaxID=121088 RepID=A0A8S1IM97_9CHLO|nr:unnamed protein product [Ostreobium quekettii]|eukprot:evm.model.scf_47.7 EVM.evm.TU.scf_47.7   scf_47:71811-77251(-)